MLQGNARARRFYERAGWRPDGALQEEELDGAVLREVRYVRDRPALDTLSVGATDADG